MTSVQAPSSEAWLTSSIPIGPFGGSPPPEGSIAETLFALPLAGFSSHRKEVPFHWQNVDRPEAGSALIAFVPARPRSDGLRYINNTEIPSSSIVTLQSNGQTVELECLEMRNGHFPPTSPQQPIPPGSPDNQLRRFRKRWRIAKPAGHPPLWFFFWGIEPHGPAIPGNWASLPIRSYPLPEPPKEQVSLFGNRNTRAPPNMNHPVVGNASIQAQAQAQAHAQVQAQAARNLAGTPTGINPAALQGLNPAQMNALRQQQLAMLASQAQAQAQVQGQAGSPRFPPGASQQQQQQPYGIPPGSSASPASMTAYSSPGSRATPLVNAGGYQPSPSAAAAAGAAVGAQTAAILASQAQAQQAQIAAAVAAQQQMAAAMAGQSTAPPSSAAAAVAQAQLRYQQQQQQQAALVQAQAQAQSQTGRRPTSSSNNKSMQGAQVPLAPHHHPQHQQQQLAQQQQQKQQQAAAIAMMQRRNEDPTGDLFDVVSSRQLAIRRLLKNQDGVARVLDARKVSLDGEVEAAAGSGGREEDDDALEAKKRKLDEEIAELARKVGLLEEAKKAVSV